MAETSSLVLLRGAATEATEILEGHYSASSAALVEIRKRVQVVTTRVEINLDMFFTEKLCFLMQCFEISENFENFYFFDFFEISQRFWALFGLRFGLLAKNNAGLCPPDLKTGGDFSSIEVNFEESCRNAFF